MCRVGLLAAVVFLSGCASLSVPSDTGERLSGRLSVRVEGEAARSFSAGFELAGTPERGQLALTSPLGLQLARATWVPGRAELDNGRERQVHADLDALASAALGERVPIAALFDWLRARPMAGVPSEPRAGGFEQLGWAVDVSRQAEGSIEARRSSAPVVTVRARLDMP